MPLIGIDKTQGKFRIQTEQKGALIVVVRVTYLPTGLTGKLTCAPKEDSVTRSVSRLKANVSHTKDPLKEDSKVKDKKVANYGKLKKST